MSEPTPAEAPVAPAEVVAPTGAAPVAEAPAPVTPTAPQPSSEVTAEQVAQYLGTTPETLAEFTRFATNNGKFDKVFEKVKTAISRPEALQAQSQAQTQNVPSQPVQTPQTGSGEPTAVSQPAPGTYSMEEMAALSYFDRLAADPKYATIADEIKTGKVMEGLRSFGISPIQDGRINDAGVRKYLDLYAATKPATPTSVTPTVEQQIEYVPVQEIKTREDADRIQLQSLQLRAQGLPPHPLEAKAKEWISNYYKNKK